MPDPWSLTRSRTCPDSRASSTATVAAGRTVLNGVLQDVQHQPAQQVLVARTGTSVAPVSANRHAPLVGQHVDGAPAFGDDLVEIQIDRPQRIAARIGAREDEHVVNQPAEPLRLAADDGERFAILRFVAMLAAERHVCRTRARSTPGYGARATRRP